MNGYWAAAIAVLISASYPVATRAGVTGSFTAQELVTLRFGVGAAIVSSARPSPIDSKRGSSERS